MKNTVQSRLEIHESILYCHDTSNLGSQTITVIPQPCDQTIQEFKNINLHNEPQLNTVIQNITPDSPGADKSEIYPGN